MAEERTTTRPELHAAGPDAELLFLQRRGPGSCHSMDSPRWNCWQWAVLATGLFVLAAENPAAAADQPSSTSGAETSKPTPVAFGCTKDSDCKGTRICDARQCVDQQVKVDAERRDSETLLIHLSADNPNAVLERVLASSGFFAVSSKGGVVSGSGSETEMVCRQPCSKLVLRDAKYRIGGLGVWPSAPFLFPNDKKEVHLKVITGSSGASLGGVLLATVGFTTAALGPLILLASLGPGQSGFAKAGGVMIAVGLPLGLLGWWISSGPGTTHVLTEEGPELGR